MTDKDYPKLHAVIFGEELFNNTLVVLLFDTIHYALIAEINTETVTHIFGSDYYEDLNYWKILLQAFYICLASICVGVVIGCISAFLTFNI